MRRDRAVSRLALGLALAGLLSGVQGCTYLTNKLNDTRDIFDVGMTYSPKFNFSLYLCAAGLATIGGGHVDGYFLGAGGDQVGLVRHYQKSIGLVLWSYEEFGWGAAEGDTVKAADRRPEELSGGAADGGNFKVVDRRHVGLLGWLFYPNRAFAPA